MVLALIEKGKGGREGEVSTDGVFMGRATNLRMIARFPEF